MMNNTLMEAILLSRALCHSECPRPECGKYIPAQTRPAAVPARVAAVQGSGITVNLGGFSVDSHTGAATFNTGGGRFGGHPGFY